VHLGVALGAQELALRRGGLAAVEQARHESAPDRAVAAPADRRVGRDAIEPCPGVVGHPPCASFADEPDERVLEELLGCLAVMDHPDEKAEDLAPVGVVQGGQHALVRTGPGAQPLEGRLRLVGCRGLR
jgi:hypothetical protein